MGPLTGLLIHEGFGNILIVKVGFVLDGVCDDHKHVLEFLADGANGMWPVGRPFESTSPVGNEVLWRLYGVCAKCKGHPT